MTRRLRVSRAALVDQQRLFEVLDEVSPSAALRSSAAIVRGLRTIAEFPHIGTLAGDVVREHVVRFGRSGYVIQYRATDEEVVVARIFHAREDR